MAAGGKALAGSGLSPADIDLVIVATCSTEASIPNVAAVVAHRLGIVAPGAYDLNAACAGFCYALATAADSIRAGTARHVLVDRRGEDDRVDRLHRPVDLHHLRRRRRRGGRRSGRRTANRPASARWCGAAPETWPTRSRIADRNSARCARTGQAVFRWATTALHPVAAAGLRAGGRHGDDLAAFVPHQANLRIIEAIARKLGVPRERVADDIVHSGNTSSASIPLALSWMAEQRTACSRAPRRCYSDSARGCRYAAQVIRYPTVPVTAAGSSTTNIPSAPNKEQAE